MRILLIEDERQLSDAVKKGLTESGFAVDQAFDGEEGEFLAESESANYDLIILDLMLPKVDGLTICKSLRKKGITTPVLMLTAKTSIEDKVTGFDVGADDYLTKPFSFLELKSRVHALIRRGNKESMPIIKISDLKLDPQKREVVRGGKVIPLTPKEFSILEFLMRHKNEVVTRTMISEHVWDYNFESMSNVIDVFVATLRQKIDKNAKVKLIHTVYGVGFRVSTR